MDSWAYSDVLAMLEGGNAQLDGFYSRHALSPASSLSEEENRCIIKERYRTNAAKFYKKKLTHHIKQIGRQGKYKGREAYRQQPRSRGNVQVRMDNKNHLKQQHKVESKMKQCKV